jgi:hypothetical protein
VGGLKVVTAQPVFIGIVIGAVNSKTEQSYDQLVASRPKKRYAPRLSVHLSESFSRFSYFSL